MIYNGGHKKSNKNCCNVSKFFSVKREEGGDIVLKHYHIRWIYN